MLGIKDPWVFSAYSLTIISGLICVIYGLINWNKGAETEAKEIEEERKWEKKDAPKASAPKPKPKAAAKPAAKATAKPPVKKAAEPTATGEVKKSTRPRRRRKKKPAAPAASKS